jgi:DNA-binding MarR family transcriptional regulator
MSADSRDEAVARIFAVMRGLVLDSDDRRREVVTATGMGFVRSKALRRLIAGPLGMSELASKLIVDRPYTSLIVDDLEQRGLVVRAVAPGDRRAKVVTLTPAGRAVAVQAEEILARPPDALARLGADELAELDRLLSALDV